MHWLFATVRFFPYWGLPLVLVFWETGVYFKRRRKAKGQIICWFIGVVLLSVIGAWFVYRGDIHSDAWVKTFLE